MKNEHLTAAESRRDSNNWRKILILFELCSSWFDLFVSFRNPCASVTHRRRKESLHSG